MRERRYTPEYAAKPQRMGSATPVMAETAFSSVRKNTPPVPVSTNTLPENPRSEEDS